MHPTANLKTEHQLIKQRICTELKKITEGAVKYESDVKQAGQFTDAELLAFCNCIKTNGYQKQWSKMEMYISLLLIIIEEARQEKIPIN